MMNCQFPKAAGERRGVHVAAINLVLLAGLALWADGMAQAASPTDIAGLQLYSNMSGTTPYSHTAYWEDVAGNHDGNYDFPAYNGGGSRATAISVGGTDSRMLLHDSLDPDLDAGLGNFSVALWYYQDPKETGNRYIWTNGNGSSSSDGGLAIYANAGAIRFGVNDIAEASGTRLQLYDPADSSRDLSGAWHHVVGVIDRTGVNGPANRLYLYVDNLLLDSKDLPAVGGSAANYNILNSDAARVPAIGGLDYTGGNFDLEGYIDDVAVYRGALSATDVNTLYHASTVNADTITTAGITPVAIHNFVNNLNRPETIGVVPDVHGGNHGAMKEFKQVVDAQRGDVIEVDGRLNATEYVDYGDVMDPMSTSYTAAL